MDQNNAAAPVSVSVSGGTLGAQCGREKYWHEKNADEKFLALGEAVEYLTREVRELRKQRVEFKAHLHGANQEILILIEIDEKLREESYFFRNPLGREKKF